MPARGTWSQFRLDFRASGVVMTEIKPDMFYRTRTCAWCTATLPAPAVLSCCSSYCLFSHLQLCSHLTDQETGTSQWFSLCPHPQTSALTVCSVTGDRTLTLITHTRTHTHTHTHTHTASSAAARRYKYFDLSPSSSCTEKPGGGEEGRWRQTDAVFK